MLVEALVEGRGGGVVLDRVLKALAWLCGAGVEVQGAGARIEGRRGVWDVEAGGGGLRSEAGGGPSAKLPVTQEFERAPGWWLECEAA